MKQIIQILFVGILLAISLVACNKEDLVIGDNQTPNRNENPDGYYINPEDTAGVIAPEGYAMVMFPGKLPEQTRAAISGTDNRINSLSGLLYKEDVDGVYKLFKEYPVFSGVTEGRKWPYATPIMFLKAGAYKIVFLGNVTNDDIRNGNTNEVLTNTATYSEARIHLPRKSFTDKNLYYLGKNEFSVTDEEITAGTKKQVPLELKRIVSRYQIMKESLADTHTGAAGNYKNKYFRQLLDGSLKDDVFTGLSSDFAQSFKTAVGNDIIKGIIYALTCTENKINMSIDATAYPVKAWYDANPISEAHKSSLNTYFAAGNNLFTSTINPYSTDALQVAQYLYDMCIATTPTAEQENRLKEILEKIYTDNKIDNGNNSTDKTTPTVTKAILMALEKFNKDYVTGILYWRNYQNTIIGMNNQTVPTSVNFDLDVTETETWGDKFYFFQTVTTDTEDYYIPIYTLGGISNNHQINVSAIYTTDLSGNTIDDVPEGRTLLNDTPFTGGNLQANRSTDCVLKITDVNLKSHSNTNGTTSDIQVCYYNLLNEILLKENAAGSISIGDFTIAKDKKTNIITDLTYLLYFAYSGRYSGIRDNIVEEVYPVQFQCPDFKVDNIEVTTIWEVKSSLD